MAPNLKVQKIHDDAVLPSYSHPGDAGLDLFSIRDVSIQPGEVTLVHTGICIELPVGTEGQIRPRSGLAMKEMVTVLNSPGTIDQGYRGEVGVLLVNHGAKTFAVTRGMKIAQLVIAPICNVQIESVAELSTTRRGEGGFGSTGNS